MTRSLEQSRSPDTDELFQIAMGVAQSGMCVAMPGIVEFYNAALQIANILPALKRPYLNSDGSEGLDDVPIINDVPVVFPRGSGFFLSFPLKKGDNVLLVFQDLSIDEFVMSQGNVQLDPRSFQTHDLRDCVAIPGFYTQPKALRSAILTAGKMALGADGVSGKYITIASNGKVDINGNFTVDP
jgi:hypothetical protein